MEEVEISPSPFLVEDRHGQHEGGDRPENHCDLQHMFFNSETQHLPKAIGFGHGDGIYAGSRASLLTGRNVGHSGDPDVDVEDSDEKRTNDDDEKKSELSGINLKMRSTLENE